MLPGVIANIDGTIDHFQLNSAVDVVNQAGILPATPFGTATGALILPTANSTLGGRLSGGVVPTANQLQDFTIPVLTGNIGQLLPTGATQSSVANTYYFPKGVSTGNYLLSYSATYDVAGTVTSISSTGINSIYTVGSPSYNYNAFGSFANVGTATPAFMFNVNVTVTAADAYVTFANVGTATTPLSVDLYVFRLPESL